jgi:hypothetical protein
MTERLGSIFELAGLRMSVHARQYPDLYDFWDGNWLNVACDCIAPGSQVRADGPFIHLSEIAVLLEKIKLLNSRSATEAKIQFIEPTLKLEFKMDSKGHIDFHVHLTPDHMNQSHSYLFEIDQSYLPDAILQCQSILQNFPLRDAPTQDNH